MPVKRLSGWDAFHLYSETPNVHTHTLKVIVIDATDFDGDYGFEVFKRTLRRRLHLLEPLRYQLVSTPLKLHRPMWQQDCNIDLDYHLRRCQVVSPGDRRELDALVGQIASTPLDRSRPLWEFHFVEGMADNLIAVVGKVHHALADGVASANLIARAMDTPGAVPDEHDPCTGTAALSTAELLRSAGRDHLQQIRRLPELVQRTASGLARVNRPSRHHADRKKHPALARNFHPPKTFMNHVVSANRTFASASIALADFKETKTHLGVTINDLILAMAAGALRELLLRYDGRADEPIIASVPASLDTSPDRITGNKLGGMLASLPVHVVDPLERVRLSRLAAEIAKENYHLLGPELPSWWVAYLPPVVTPSVFRWLSRRHARNRLFNLPISNVPGPRHRGRFANAPISEIYSAGPLVAGCGINITVWSYADQLNISVLADDQTLRDPHEATEAMILAFAEIRSAAGLSAELTHLDTVMAQASWTG